MIKLLLEVKKIAIHLTLFSFIAFTGLSFTQPELELIAPKGDHITSNNTPLLTLLPGESANISVSIRNQDITEMPVISCKAYNMQDRIVISENLQ